MSPNDYFYQQEPQKMVIEPTAIPNAIWVLLGIALVGAFLIAFYSLKIIGETKKESSHDVKKKE